MFGIRVDFWPGGGVQRYPKQPRGLGLIWGVVTANIKPADTDRITNLQANRPDYIREVKTRSGSWEFDLYQ